MPMKHGCIHTVHKPAHTHTKHLYSYPYKQIWIAIFHLGLILVHVPQIKQRDQVISSYHLWLVLSLCKANRYNWTSDDLKLLSIRLHVKTCISRLSAPCRRTWPLYIVITELGFGTSVAFSCKGKRRGCCYYLCTWQSNTTHFSALLLFLSRFLSLQHILTQRSRL